MISPEFKPHLVSVIIPTHNRARHIKRAAASVIGQSYRPLELIVVDDGSTDATKSVIFDLKKQCKADAKIQIHYRFQKKAGAAAARNKAFGISKGEFIQVLGSDDILSKDKLKNQITALRNEPEFCVAYGSWRIACNGSGLLKYGPLRQKKTAGSEDKMLRGYLSSEWFCPEHSYLFRREVIAKTGLFDERLLRRQDTDYLIRVLLNGYRFLYVDDATVYYTRHSDEHIGSPKNYDKHFLSSLWVIDNAYSNLNAKGSFDRYSEEIRQYLLRLANEALYMGYHRGAGLVAEKNKCWFNTDSCECRLHSSYSQLRLKRKLVKFAKRHLGECTLDWINQAVRRGPDG